MGDGSNNTALDKDEILKRYALEKAKRSGDVSDRHYTRLEGKFSHFQIDPHTPYHERSSVEREVTAVVLGSGWAGIHSGLNIKLAGIDDVCVIDKAGDFGGVWYWNRYPGVACDTESYIYMPMLEEMGVMPKANYASGAEILAHAQAIARKYGLYENALLQTGVTEARWDEKANRWRLTTDRGDAITTKYFVVTAGALQTPKLPRIDGVEDFAGHCFHTSRWDYEYTGGDSSGGLSRLAGKRVAIIGTGATAIQCIPHLAQSAGHLYVVQRTPSTIDVRNEHPTDKNWYTSQPPGWQMERIRNFNTVTAMEPFTVDLVDDGWTRPAVEAARRIRPDMASGEVQAVLDAVDLETTERIRARVSEVVHDPAVAERLKAWYPRMCKRPCFHDGYLDVYNRDNVTLVDTQGRGVESITPEGFSVNGKQYDVDCIIYSTGFELGPYAETPVTLPVFGKDGLTLKDKWRDGATTMHGFHIHGFPNFFMVSIAQSAWGFNFMQMLLEQGKHIGYLIGELERRGANRAEVTATAEAAWVAHHESLATRMANVENCTPGWVNNEGNLSIRTARGGAYGGGVNAFLTILEQWRAKGDLEGLAIE
ncbi:NAD(P)/FAD-dependent oxidoreductase [Sphingobium soli]|uniref:NAD(P)/FAD-dependent oxidoreductase n=1 Tax=Sphingobium soli TaxID=1591116 RepID=A0ABS8H159_9SPHN|nr:NAD(P)/FAD-dependent oxidoreductase [Sphingobium soli]MCC4232260.1 NAD(P)/FAD-dependent oxidoreductase [Sphingobium soli]